MITTTVNSTEQINASVLSIKKDMNKAAQKAINATNDYIKKIQGEVNGDIAAVSKELNGKVDDLTETLNGISEDISELQTKVTALETANNMSEDSHLVGKIWIPSDGWHDLYERTLIGTATSDHTGLTAINYSLDIPGTVDKIISLNIATSYNGTTKIIYDLATISSTHIGFINHYSEGTTFEFYITFRFTLLGH
jgi:hypothetical protein